MFIYESQELITVSKDLDKTIFNFIEVLDRYLPFYVLLEKDTRPQDCILQYRVGIVTYMELNTNFRVLARSDRKRRLLKLHPVDLSKEIGINRADIEFTDVENQDNFDYRNFIGIIDTSLRFNRKIYGHSFNLEYRDILKKRCYQFPNALELLEDFEPLYV